MTYHHYNEKKSIFSINSTHSEFLKREHTIENLQKERKTSFTSIYHFFKLIFSNHSKIIDWKSNFFKILLEPYWSNSWYTISVSILYTTTLWESHYCIQQIICWNGLIFTHKKIVCGYSSSFKEDFVTVWSSPVRRLGTV